MKKLLFLFLSAIVLTSCEKNVEFNNPAFQGLIDNSVWKATSSSATKSASGAITIKGIAAGNVELNINSTALGTRVLGTTNTSNFASYTLNAFNYTTGITPSPVNKIVLSAGGTGYTTSNLVLTSGGSGTGLKVDIDANTSGVVTRVVVNAPGNNYRAGDLVTIVTGNADAKFIVQNVANSNGEITITQYDGATISGNFKFTAYDAVNKKTAGCQNGVFYKIPVN
jgi:carbon monoxide dehydrogenase subunit G